jgi:CDP-diglyceride synthetase
MDDERTEQTAEQPIGEKVARVRIIGAEPAGTRADAGPSEPDEFDSGGVSGFLDAEPGEVSAEGTAPSAPEEPAMAPLPHWTEAPTGEVPAVLIRDGEGAEGEEDPWAAVPGPTWREEHADWTAQEEAFEPSVLAQDEPRAGAVDDEETIERRPWEFELSTAGEARGEPGGEPSGPEGYSDEDTMIVAAVRPPSEVAYQFDELSESSELVVVVGIEGEAVEADELPGAKGIGERAAEEPADEDLEGGSVRRMRRGAARPGRLRARSEAEDRALVEPSAPFGRPDHGGRPVPRAPRPVARAPQVPRRAPRPPVPGARVAATPGTLAGGRNIPVAVASGLAFGVVAVVCFYFGNLPALVVSSVVLTLAAAEIFAALRNAGYRPVTVLGLVATVSLMIATYNRGETAVPLILVLLFAFTLLWHLAGVDRNAEPLFSTAATMLVFCWVGVFGSFAALLLNPTYFPNRHGVALLFGAIVAVVAYDVGALAVGSWIGKHPLAPHASPHKTWEGFFGGAVVAIVVSVAIVRIMHPWTLGSAAALGVVVAVASPIGDLSESLVKRHLGLKDMGRILPGHGGVLDRVDGLLFVLPATYYLAKAFHLG